MPTPRTERVEPGEELLLGRQLLDDRLDHGVAAGERVERVAEREPRERGSALLGADPTLLDATPEVAGDPLARPFRRAGRDVHADDVQAGLGAHLRDPRAHRPEPDDADPAHLHAGQTSGAGCSRSCAASVHRSHGRSRS
jgi:hypothetical protein